MKPKIMWAVICKTSRGSEWIYCVEDTRINAIRKYNEPGEGQTSFHAQKRAGWVRVAKVIITEMPLVKK